jgi:hypothetical protein
MSRNRDGRDREFTVAEEGAGRNRFKAAVVTLLAVVAILLCTCFFAARTDSFRQMVENYIETRTGMEVGVERTRIGWPYSLVIEGIVSDAKKGEELAGINIKELRVGLGVPMLKVIARGCTISLMGVEDGTWRPLFLSRLGAVREVEQISALTESFRKKAALKIELSTIIWFDSGGSRILRVEGLNFSISPTVLENGRRLSHCCMSAYDVIHEDGERVYDFQREWFITEDNRVIEIGVTKKEAGTADRPAGTGSEDKQGGDR